MAASAAEPWPQAFQTGANPHGRKTLRPFRLREGDALTYEVKTVLDLDMALKLARTSCMLNQRWTASHRQLMDLGHVEGLLTNITEEKSDTVTLQRLRDIVKAVRTAKDNCYKSLAAWGSVRTISFGRANVSGTSRQRDLSASSRGTTRSHDSGARSSAHSTADADTDWRRR
ncbi:unnamed protein product [Effrenium voratum]|uniref:Uncharacterized protein n=1 Tax=Effrenium voratum TaxID=2562239 RepID=A0AA36I9J8_9DINO|nr:unnamed protein product [Effrenium voratum]